VYTIKQFCALAQISERSFYILKAQGLAPVLTKQGKNLAINHEAATKWLQKRTERVA
jgi:hypothetical protein